MIKWYQRQKLIHQIALTILVGFLLSFILTLYLLSYDKSQRLNQLSTAGALQRATALAATLQQTPKELHASILRASGSADFRVSLSRFPQVQQSHAPKRVIEQLLAHLQESGVTNAHIALINTGERPMMDFSEHHENSMHRSMASMMGNGFSRHMGYSGGEHQYPQYNATVNGSLQLTTGQWLNFSSGIANDMTHWSTGVLIALIGMMMLTTLAALLIIRSALKPIAALGRAATSFAHNKQVVEVDNNGPKDLAPTIDAFNDMQQQVTSYIKERTKLLAAISHDLRTPLTSLRLRLEFIEEGDDREQMLATINTMERMLTETMRFAKNDAEKEVRQMTNIDSLLQTIVDEYDEKGIEIGYSNSTALTANIPPLSLRRMIENLVNNAIQYAGAEAVITLSMEHDEQFLTVYVADNGVGIPEDKLDEVLKPFTRLNEARDTAGSNVGLGLSITHSLATAFGGKLQLEANQPHGLKASVTISL